MRKHYFEDFKATTKYVPSMRDKDKTLFLRKVDEYMTERFEAHKDNSSMKILLGALFSPKLMKDNFKTQKTKLELVN